jgi:nucleotide-binding universal stress UspA family protein
MFERFLVPLDGSALAECVLPHVVALAGTFGSQVTLLRVMDQAQADEPHTHSIDPVQWHIEKAEAAAYMDQVASRLAPTKVPTQILLREGHAAETIAELAPGYDLLALSSHGRSGLSGWNISSIGQKVLLRSACSTLIVRAYGPAYPSADQPIDGLRYRRIFVPLDGSWRAEVALPCATTLCQQNGSELVLAHIIGKPEMPRRTPPSEEDTRLIQRIVERNREEAEAYFNQLQTRLPVNAHITVHEADSVAPALHQLVIEEEADLVVLSAHGYSGQTQWPYGSNVVGFIAYGSTPLFIVQDAPADAAGPAQDRAATTRGTAADQYAQPSALSSAQHGSH